ncbi:MAG: hypothetical protein L0G27_10475 [Paracoccus sp. (in: a-proteobacteria)]|nr:hypothetical protein [Paracoccus sp. (in: a-proteobacteria)]
MVPDKAFASSANSPASAPGVKAIGTAVGQPPRCDKAAGQAEAGRVPSNTGAMVHGMSMPKTLAGMGAASARTAIIGLAKDDMC